MVSTWGLEYTTGIEETYQGILGTFSLVNPNIYPTRTPSPTTIPAGGAEGNAVMCTMEAMLCPDGSSVGRVGPKCEFAPCPSNTP
jgi:hypothetical protein